VTRLIGALVAACALASVVTAQPLEFEVATVKALPPPDITASLAINLGTYRNGSLTMNNVTLSEALQFAYELVSEDQVSGPDWIKSRSTMYQVAAKTTPDVELSGARALTQKLLAERLKVVVRKEKRLVSFAALVLAKDGPKVVEADPARPGPPEASYSIGRIVGSSTPMGVLALLLSRFERQLILDRTGLTGRYQMKLEYTPADRAGAAGDLAGGVSLAAALQEQLGLRLESRREPLDAIVVERAERVPTDN
jgi:uncharacterized protein (TIGR03435 family)